jgi:hypothetical protein
MVLPVVNGVFYRLGETGSACTGLNFAYNALIAHFLAMGKREIKSGQFRSAEKVSAQLDGEGSNAS